MSSCHQEMRLDELHQLRPLEIHVMQLAAIGAAVLLDQNHQVLATGAGLGQILAQVEERIQEPGLLVQPVIAQFDMPPRPRPPP
ncbi:MAG: hypothetical protein R3D85_16795 [Paracoccaceae bacterium]